MSDNPTSNQDLIRILRTTYGAMDVRPKEAANAIERQEAEIRRLRTALTVIYEEIPARPNMTEAGRVAMMAEIARANVSGTSPVETTDRIEHLEFVLRGFYWDQVDYIKRNHLGGMNNHWMRATRIALGIQPDDPIPSVEPTPKEVELFDGESHIHRRSESTPKASAPCSYCFGDKTVSMSDGSKRMCELCGGTGRVEVNGPGEQK